MSGKCKKILEPEEAQEVARMYLAGIPINKIRSILHHDGSTISNTLTFYKVARRDKKVYSKRAKKSVPYYSEDDTICWGCQRSCTKESDQCSWVRSFRPVAGWVAEPTVCDKSVGETSFNVRSCPMFVSDKKKGAVSA